MQRIYAFSGLGVDKRAFTKLDLSGFEVVHVEWISPRSTESLDSYVMRLADHYQIPKRGAYVLGVSFGGMCISQLSNYYDFEKVVLISSAKTKYELPKLYKLTKHFGLPSFLPSSQLRKPNPVINWLFGVKSTEEKSVLAEIIRDSEPEFVKWALEKIVVWNNTKIPINCLHIHGDQDRIIPIRNVDCSIRVRGGGHFMVLNKAIELSFSIRNFLS